MAIENLSCSNHVLSKHESEMHDTNFRRYNRKMQVVTVYMKDWGLVFIELYFFSIVQQKEQ